MSIFNSFGKFLVKYSGEVSVIAATLSRIVNAIPFNSEDKSDLTDGIAKLEETAANVAKAAADIVKRAGAVDEKAIRDSVTRVLKSKETSDAIAALVSAELAAAKARAIPGTGE